MNDDPRALMIVQWAITLMSHNPNYVGRELGDVVDEILVEVETVGDWIAGVPPEGETLQ